MRHLLLPILLLLLPSCSCSVASKGLASLKPEEATQRTEQKQELADYETLPRLAGDLARLERLASLELVASRKAHLQSLAEMARVRLEEARKKFLVADRQEGR